MTKKSLLLITMLILTMMLLTGCLPGDGSYTDADPAGFFWGVWHGWVAPVSLIVGLFNKGIRVYEVANSGWWYDFGFYIAVISGFGGLSMSRRRKSKKDE